MLDLIFAIVAALVIFSLLGWVLAFIGAMISAVWDCREPQKW